MNAAAVTPRTPAELREHLSHSRGFVEGRAVGFDEGYSEGQRSSDGPGLTHAGAFFVGFIAGAGSCLFVGGAVYLGVEVGRLVVDVVDALNR